MDGKQLINEVLDHFQETEDDPGGDWAFFDDYSSLCLDHNRKGIVFWLEIERDGFIRLVWKKGDDDLVSMNFAPLNKRRDHDRLSAVSPQADRRTSPSGSN